MNLSISLCLADSPGGVRARTTHVWAHLSSWKIEGTGFLLDLFTCGGHNLYVPTKSVLKLHWLILFHEFVAGQREVLQTTKDIAVAQLLSAAHVEMNNYEQLPEPTSRSRGDTTEDVMKSLLPLLDLCVCSTVHGSDQRVCFFLQNYLWLQFNKCTTIRWLLLIQLETRQKNIQDATRKWRR